MTGEVSGVDLGMGQALQGSSSPQPITGHPAQLSSRGVVVLGICRGARKQADVRKSLLQPPIPLLAHQLLHRNDRHTGCTPSAEAVPQSQAFWHYIACMDGWDDGWIGA